MKKHQSTLSGKKTTHTIVRTSGKAEFRSGHVWGDYAFFHVFDPSPDQYSYKRPATAVPMISVYYYHIKEIGHKNA